MGKVIFRSKYEYYEYVTAVLISIGMTFFLLGSSEASAGKFNYSNFDNRYNIAEDIV